MRAHQIMTRDVITVLPDTSILEAANKTLENHVSGLPVVDSSGQLVGIVSESDFLRRAEIGTQHKRARWLQYFLSPGRVAGDFVQERGQRGSLTAPGCTCDQNKANFLPRDFFKNWRQIERRQ